MADVIQIGARNMQNYPLLAEIGRSGCPVLIKRGLSATLEELLMAAEYVLKEGNPNVMLCERGIRTFETAYRFTLDLMAVPVLKQLTHLPVIVDPSHAAGRRDLVLPLSLAAAAVGRRRDHRRGAPEPRGGDLRRAPAALRGRLLRVRRPGGAGRRARRQGAVGRVSATARFAPSGPLRGTLAVPPDKSISHRAALLASMGDEPVRITGYLDAADTRSTLDAVRALGALVSAPADGALVVRGPGLRGIASVDGPSTSATPAR